jgi:hypothetical protein
LALCIASVQGAPVITNPAAAQRPGTKLVDIDYNLTGTTKPMIIALEISADGGTTWAVPVTALTGAVGANVTPGSNLRITWDAGVDWNNKLSPQMQFRLNVNPNAQQDSSVFSQITAGNFTMGDTLDGMTDAPPHTVNLSAFYMQKLETTKGQWDAVRDWGLLHGYTDIAAGRGQGALHPVHKVSWYDVVKWCNAKSEKDGDSDGDRFSDGYEVKHGANPNDATDFPRAKLMIFTAVEVRLESELGQLYRIESSTDLKTWTLVEEHIPGTGGEIVKFYSIQEIPKRYFRAMPEPPAPPAGE